MAKLRAPIPYFGGKGTMLNDLLLHFVMEGIDTFADLYGGSGTVLLGKPQVQTEIYNDLDPNPSAIFRVLRHTDLYPEWKERLDMALFSEKLGKHAKEMLKDEDLPLLDRAYYFYIAARMYRGGGLGGIKVNTVVRRGMSKSTSDWLSSLDTLDALHKRLEDVQVYNSDALLWIRLLDRKGAFIYLDPPYEHSTRTSARYMVDASYDHHEQLVDTLLLVENARVCLSGYRTEVYEPLEHRGWRREDFTVKTVSAKNESRDKVESVWMNYHPNGEIISR